MSSWGVRFTWFDYNTGQDKWEKSHWDFRNGYHVKITVIKVIPSKLFHYQTFFETWRNEHSWYEHYKNAIKRRGHRACLRVSRLLKWGIFTGCAVKVWITFIYRITLGYLKGTKFCLESKVSFIDISSIASFKPFLLPGCGNIALFRTVPWLTWSPRVGQNTPSWKLF